MRGLASPLFSAALLLSCLALPQSVQAAPAYTFADLGLLRSGDDFSSANDINAAGEVVGVSGSLTIERAILWQRGATIDLGPLPGGFTSMAQGINNRGQIVGGARLESTDDLRVFHAAIWNDRAITPLEELPEARESMAFAINALGQAVGYSDAPGGRRPVVWIGGEVSPLSSDVGEAQDINNRGQVVGTVGTSAVRWELGTSGDTLLGDLPGGADSSTAFAINQTGQIVGQGSAADGVHAFLWSNGIMIDLGVLPGSETSRAFDINDRGQVVGTSRDGGIAANRAFLWENGEMFDLNALVDDLDGWLLLSAQAINNRGQIVGQAFSADLSEFHAFLLTPVPEPRAAGLLLLGLLGVRAVRRLRSRTAAL